MRLMQRILTIGFLVFAAGLFAATASQAAPPDKVTICHAAGQDGTDKFVELTLPENAVFGQAGHFNEDGTTQAGHEDDTLGPCDKKEPPKDDEPDPKATAI